MPQNFLPCDRDQSLRLAPDLRDWLPEDHLAWFLIDAVAELDPSAFFGDYRADGHGRAAHDPGMMVALLTYSYATGERSSRKIEKRCREDIAHRVICASQAPDHATIARFRSRHQDALAGLFTEVLKLCSKAGLVQIGTIAFDGTRMAADAADRNNKTYRQLGKEILEEAEAADAAEDAEFGEKRGDELPAELATRKSRLERMREAKRQLEEERQAKLDEMEAWKQAKAEFIERTGKGQGWPTKPRPIPDQPDRRINTTDLDSRPVKTATGFIQGYTAQAAAAEGQVIVSAELITGGNERHRRGPMAEAATEELKQAGITEQPEIVLADAGYWNSSQIEAIEAKGIRVLVPPDADTRKAPTNDRAGLCPDQGWPAGRPLPTKRLGGLPLGMAADCRHTQPAEAPQERSGADRGIGGSDRRSARAGDHPSLIALFRSPLRDSLHANRRFWRTAGLHALLRHRQRSISPQTRPRHWAPTPFWCPNRR